MERREEYEPIILDLQKSHAIREPKRHIPIFLCSLAIFGILLIFAAFYFKQPSNSQGTQTTQTSGSKTPVAAKPTNVPIVSIPEPTPAVQPATTAPGEKGWLTLYSYPENAEVVINGNVLGHTPLRNYELDPDTYIVNFSYEGLVSQQEITISAGKTTKFTHRFPGFASLKIDTTSSGCDITVNGKPAGKSPVLLEGLSPGTYTIVATKVGYATAEKTVTLKKGEHKEPFITIKRLDSVIRETSTPTPSGRPLHPSERLRQQTP